MIAFNVWGTGIVRMLCALEGLIIGYAMSAAFGLLGRAHLASLESVAWIALPAFQHDHWSFDAALVIPFLVACLAVAMKAVGTITVCQRMVDANPEIEGTVRGRGLIQGIHSPIAEFGELVAREAFKRGLVMETSGPDSEVAKVLPPLVIEDELLERGLAIMAEAVAAVAATLKSHEPALAATAGG